MLLKQITHIHKDDRMDPTTAILWIGGTDATGRRWRMTMRTAAELVRTGQAAFFTHENDQYAEVEALPGPSGLYYLRTDPDGTGANNLLHLPPLDATFEVVGIINRAMQQPNLGFGMPPGLLSQIPTDGIGAAPTHGLLSTDASPKAAGFVPASLRSGLLNWQDTAKR